jgi:tetratricopeptide (TPR) repeat protein
MSDTLKEEGLALFRQGKRAEALTTFEAAAASYADAGDKIGQGEVMNNIGVIRRVEHEWPASLAAFKEAAGLFAEAGDENRRAQVLGNLGDLYAYQGERDTAASYYGEGAELMAATGDRAKQSQLLRALSLLRLRQGQFVEAILHMEQSIKAHPAPNVAQRLLGAAIAVMLRLMGR